MRRWSSRSLAATVVVAAVLLGAACSSAALKTEYVTVTAAKDGVDLAMRTWAQHVATAGRCAATNPLAGCVTDKDEGTVRSAYSDVQLAARTAGVALRTGNTAVTPESLRAAIAALVAVVSRLTGKDLSGVHAGIPAAAREVRS
jgi:hypothetical protein